MLAVTLKGSILVYGGRLTFLVNEVYSLSSAAEVQARAMSHFVYSHWLS